METRQKMRYKHENYFINKTKKTFRIQFKLEKLQ